MRKSSSGSGFALLAFIPLSMLTIAACSTSAGTAAPETGQGGGGMCTADQVTQFIGKPATPALGAEIMRATGASNFRWVQHGMVVTMEYREGRVTAWLDRQNQVERVSCG